MNLLCRYIPKPSPDLGKKDFEVMVPGGIVKSMGGWSEETLEYKYVGLPIDPARTILILVDVWEKHHCRSFKFRADGITVRKINPAIAAARRAKIHVVHAVGGAKISALVDRSAKDTVANNLHDVNGALKSTKANTLIYAGFATNMCILKKDYGIERMNRGGRKIVLLRDATTGVEYPNTIVDMAATRAAIGHVEWRHGYTAIVQDFVDMCEGNG